MEKLDVLFERTAASVLIVENEQILYEKSFGFAQIETHRRNSSATNFRLASLTKQFVGFAIFRLECDGLLRRTDAIGNYFSSAFNEKYPRLSREVTIAHLLEHRSGIFDYEDNALEQNSQWTDDDVLQHLSDSTHFPPGEQFQYSRRMLDNHVVKRCF